MISPSELQGFAGTEDQRQEALSAKYSDHGLFLVPLDDGSWALFTTGRELVIIMSFVQVDVMPKLNMLGFIEVVKHVVEKSGASRPASRHEVIVQAGKTFGEMDL